MGMLEVALPPDRMGCGNVGGGTATSRMGCGNVGGATSNIPTMLEVAPFPQDGVSGVGGAPFPQDGVWECWRWHLTGWGVGMLEVPPPTGWGVGMSGGTDT